jgi:hypothetical protein
MNKSYALKDKTTSLLFTLFNNDTLVKKDSVIEKDTLMKPVPRKSFIDEKVKYSADDSMIIDMESKKAYLYKNAVVIYGDMKLTAGYIEIDFNKSMIYSRGIKDSSGLLVQKPVSEQADEKFTATEITYNFKTKKGKIKDVLTQQGEGYIHGGGIKKDSTNVFFVAHGKYTTCDLEHPHFYIGAKKIKVIPNDKIITGPAQLVIMDVPTPLAVPFGFFPNKKGRASGILIPTYGESQTMGFNLQNGGYYFGKDEHVDLALTGNIYTNGSYALMTLSNYKKRYQYNGTVNLKYAYNINGNPLFSTTTRQSNYSIVWRHNQDIKSHPGSNFSANVNIASSLYNKYNGDVASGVYTTSTLQSSISYSKKLGTNFNFSANAMQSQNTILKQTTYDLPNIALTMNRIFPFKSNTKVGNYWYDKIGLSATVNEKNHLVQYDSILYSAKSIGTNLQKFNNGIQVLIPISTSVNLLKYFTLKPSINTSSYFYAKTTEEYDKYDTVKKKNFTHTDTVNSPKVATTYNLSASLTTMFYGNYRFKSKHVKQIRHVITPAINLTYAPDFSASKYGYYKPVTDSNGVIQKYSIFQNGILGGPPLGEQNVIGFSINNTLEAKIKKDSDSGSVMKKIVLIQALSVATSYNAALKVNNWSPITIAGRTQLFKLLNVNGGATLNPYQVNSLGQQVQTNSEGQQFQKYEWENHRIGRLTAANLALSASFKSKASSSKNKTSNNPAHQDELDYIKTHPNAYVDFNIPWTLNVSYNIYYGNNNPPAKSTLTQTAAFNGSITLTKKWNLNVSSGYDIIAEKVSLTSISVNRDLHCWQMSFNWIPFGLRQSYTLTINVKSSVLQDLKLTRKGYWQDYQ